MRTVVVSKATGAYSNVVATESAPWILEYKPRGCRKWRLYRIGAHREGRCFESPTTAYQALSGNTRHPNERIRNALTGDVLDALSLT